MSSCGELADVIHTGQLKKCFELTLRFLSTHFFEFLTSKQSGAGISNFQFFLQSKLKWWQIKRDGKNLKKKQEREKSNVTSRRTSFKVDCLHHDQGEETSYTCTHSIHGCLCYPPVASHYIPPRSFYLSCCLTHAHTDRLEAEFRDTHYYYYYYTESSTNGTSFCLQLGPNHFCQ